MLKSEEFFFTGIIPILLALENTVIWFLSAISWFKFYLISVKASFTSTHKAC